MVKLADYYGLLASIRIKVMSFLHILHLVLQHFRSHWLTSLSKISILFCYKFCTQLEIFKVSSLTVLATEEVVFKSRAQFRQEELLEVLFRVVQLVKDHLVHPLVHRAALAHRAALVHQAVPELVAVVSYYARYDMKPHLLVDIGDAFSTK